MVTVEHFKAVAQDLLQFGPYEDNLFLQSLRASVHMHSDPQAFLQVFEEVTAPAQTQLDIHLVGPGIHQHEADAGELGKLLTHLSKATMNFAKDLIGEPKFKPQNIKVQGFQSGSVRVVLNAPSAKLPTEHTGVDEAIIDEPQTTESNALWQIGAVFTECSNEDAIDAAEPALLAGMSATTRSHLKNAVSVLKKNNWEIEGTAALRGAGKQKIELSARGANKLVETLKVEQPVMESKKAFGTFTGHKAWGRHEVYFKPDTGQEITLRTTVPSLLLEATKLTTDEHNKVEIIYHETQLINSKGELIPGRVSRDLRSIKPYEHHLAGEETELEI